MPACRWGPGHTEHVQQLPPGVGHVQSHEPQDKGGSSGYDAGRSVDSLEN